jgi:hypothetical protein
VGCQRPRPQVGRASLVDGDVELGEELADPVVDVVDDAAHGVDVLAWGVVDGPVLALAREGGAGLAAAHRDDDVGGFHHVGVKLGRLLGIRRQAPVVSTSATTGLTESFGSLPAERPHRRSAR